MKGRVIPYSQEELDWIEARRSTPRRALHLAFCERFDRSDVSYDNFKALCTRKGWRTGRTGCFEPGMVPHNKGKACAPGKGGRHPNARKTQFRKGQLPHNTKFLGHERVSKDGYVEISVDQVNPHTGFNRRYVLKHKWLWEQLHGPVPKGHCLKALDGNRQNTDPSNWEPIPRAMLPRLNGRFGRGYDGAEPEIKPLIMATVKLKHRSGALRRKRGGDAQG